MRATLILIGAALTQARGNFPSVTGSQRVSSRVKYLTPGCQNTNNNVKEHVGMSAGDSIKITIDGQIGLLLDEKPWLVSELPEPRPDLLLYTPATTFIDGPLFAQNVTIGGYFTVGNISLSSSSDMSALQGPPG